MVYHYEHTRSSCSTTEEGKEMCAVHIQQAEAGSWIRGQQSADHYGSKPDK